ncbi:hypothetical protein, partial [Escherichia coli]|uniref:hypothetical protein n=1 Tax=Escherichia coli TaxID=562 RepID=UPI0019549C3B
MTQARRPGRAPASGPAGPLTPVGPEDLSIRRIRAGRGFVYRDAADKPVRKASVLARIRALAVPPAYAEVRISADPDAHLQAVGRD